MHFRFFIVLSYILLLVMSQYLGPFQLRCVNCGAQRNFIRLATLFGWMLPLHVPLLTCTRRM